MADSWFKQVRGADVLLAHPTSPAGRGVPWSFVGVAHAESPAGLEVDWAPMGAPHPNSPAGREFLFSTLRGLRNQSPYTIGTKASDREVLLGGGESPKDPMGFERYQGDIGRGKSLIQLMAVKAQMTPDIRASWSARSFTPVITPRGEFDEVICNVSYHFHKHGQKYGSIRLMTQHAKRYFEQNRAMAVETDEKLLRFPDNSLFEQDGRIVTFVG